MTSSDQSNNEFGPPITYTKVKSNQMSSRGDVQSTTYLDRGLTPDTIHWGTHVAIMAGAELNKIEPKPRVSKAIDFGKEMILKTLGQDITEDNKRAMQVVFLPSNKYDEITGRQSDGIMFPGLSQVLIKLNPEDTDFYTASKGFHELVHRWVEMQHHVYYDVVDEKANTRETHIEIRRQGMQIRKTKRDQSTGKVTGTEFEGELINELGTIAWQSLFIHRVFRDPEMQDLYKDEIEFRSQELQKLFGEVKSGSVTAIIGIDEDSEKYLVRINSDNLFWDKKGKLDISSPILIMQLVDDLSSIVGNIGDMNLSSVLVSLKTRPEQQHHLKTAIDKKLGQGFYSRLRKINYHSLDSILAILEEVQSKMPTNEL